MTEARLTAPTDGDPPRDRPGSPPPGALPERPRLRPMAVAIGAVALLVGSGVQLMFVVVLLLGGVEQRFIPTLALAGGLATIGMLAAIRAWMGRDWGIDVLVATLEILASPWLFGLDAVGFGLIVAFSVALAGLVNGRAWFRTPDDRDA